ncbi:protein son of sevenless isoform X3 [Bicyclus anynana]|uniref:Protein son of sevenless isoform X3 n=1 Tax=Bicyclus anynana TaxID=110368 RepID=A0ABM3LIT4_BICAN|nr:protein son of sevenless isoform X3 [Bicyclus anynana]
MLPTVEESRGYDFQDPENSDLWRGLFVPSLKKILESLHPTLTAEQSALDFVESLCLRLLTMLCTLPFPLTVQDVEQRVAQTFPKPFDQWTVKDARDVSTLRRRKLLPLDKIHQYIQKEVLQYKIDMSVTLHIVAILEYISTDVLRLAGTFVKKISMKSGYQVITTRDIKTAMCADKLLIDMFYQDSDLAGIVAINASSLGADRRGRRGSLSYSEIVRDLIADERSFLRDLNLIIRVFKDELEKILEGDHRAISLIFGNIVDIYELTVMLLGNLEDAMEIAQDSPTPYVGSCFEELAEVEEFRAYVRYANIITQKQSRDALQKVVDDPVLAERLDTAGHGFRLAVKYCLPRLLLTPVAHVYLYHSYVRALLPVAPSHDDRESFKQVECNLHPIEKLLTKAMGNGPKLEGAIRSANRLRRQLATEKITDLSKNVDNWDARDVPQCCNEFIREDTLSKLGPGKRVAERRAFLFDGLLLLCKPVTSLQMTVNSGASTSGPQQLKLKEKLHIRKLEIVDRPDGEEGRNLIELCPRVGPSVILSASSIAEKRNWMCDLVMLNTKPMLDRSLDSILLDLERRHPLQLPPVSLYRFAEPDSVDNIVLEERPGSAPLIKGATLLKLVERLTYHVHADLNLVRTFLTTYRSFCTPAELLELLIERFDIPEPHLVYDTPRPVPRIKTPKKDISPNASLLDLDLDIEACVEISVSSDAEKLSKNTAREDWKRYRKEFQQPVKFRVINVLRHWVDQHFYDFERDPELLDRLKSFLASVDGKPMKKWVQSVYKTVLKKTGVVIPGSGQGNGQGSDQGNGQGNGQGNFPGIVPGNVPGSVPGIIPGSIPFIVPGNGPVNVPGNGPGSGQGDTDSIASGFSTTSTETSASVSGSQSGSTKAKSGVSHVFDRQPPAPIKHLADPDKYGWHPLTLHPLELARQLTLLEFQLYRQVKPSELVGAVWTKKDKENTSPNLLRIIKHTTNFTRWMEKWIVESENLDERVAVVTRFLEVAMSLSDLNNFNGVLAVVAACGSASVHRLRHTFQLVQRYPLRVLEQLTKLNSDHFRRYQEKLRSINPPCVPFFGMYLTNILHIEEGNQDCLSNSDLINFSKRRKVAEITGEIQQYQNQPYCLTVEPKTRAFLETLDPFPDMNDNQVTNYLYDKSLEIEPRNSTKPLTKPRKYPDLSLKPVKVSRRLHETQNHRESTSSISSMSDDTSSVAQLSPTSGWDGASVASLNVNDHGSKDDKAPLTSPLEHSADRSTSLGQLSQLSQLSLFEQGWKLFDKTRSTTSLNRHSGSTKDEPPSPRDNHSPSKWNSGSRKTLSPRGPTADSDSFCTRTLDHLQHKKPATVDPPQPKEPVPPLFPRFLTGAIPPLPPSLPNDSEAPPVVPRRPPSPHTAISEVPPEPPDRPLQSPKHHDLFKSPAMSPKRSPAPAPPISPHDRAAFNFPSTTTSPSAHFNSDGTAPPPLPPRKRRDSTAPHTPHLGSSWCCTVHGADGSPSGASPAGPAPPAPPVPPPMSSTPPPLPPRPPPPPELLRPASSALLQRRHTAALAPKLPPKPAAAAVAPRT